MTVWALVICTRARCLPRRKAAYRKASETKLAVLRPDPARRASNDKLGLGLGLGLGVAYPADELFSQTPARGGQPLHGLHRLEVLGGARGGRALRAADGILGGARLGAAAVVAVGIVIIAVLIVVVVAIVVIVVIVVPALHIHTLFLGTGLTLVRLAAGFL